MRAPTAKTVNRLTTVEVPMPVDCFNKFMEPMQEDPEIGINRDDQGCLTPSRSTATSDYYEYLLTKPTKYDLLFALETTDRKKYQVSKHSI